MQINIPEGFQINDILYLHKNKKGRVNHELIEIRYAQKQYLQQELENKITEYKLEHL